MDELACIRGAYGFVCGVGLDERAYQQLVKCAHKHSDDAKLEARLRRRLVVIARFLQLTQKPCSLAPLQLCKCSGHKQVQAAGSTAACSEAVSEQSARGRI